MQAIKFGKIWICYAWLPPRLTDLGFSIYLDNFYKECCKLSLFYAGRTLQFSNINEILRLQAMFEKGVDKHYVSEIDKFLEQLRQKAISKSQVNEFLEYQDIYKKRDYPVIAQAPFEKVG